MRRNLGRRGGGAPWTVVLVYPRSFPHTFIWARPERLGEHESSNCVRFITIHATAKRRRGSFLGHGVDDASIETRQQCPFRDVLFHEFAKSSLNISDIGDPSKRQRGWRCQPALLQERRQCRSPNSSSSISVVVDCASRDPAWRKAAVALHLWRRVCRDGDRADLPAKGLGGARHVHGPAEGQVARRPGD